MAYKTNILALIVKPDSEPIFSVQATELRISDEAAGCFVEIRQPRADAEPGIVRIDYDEWEQIQNGMDRLFAEIIDIEAKAE